MSSGKSKGFKVSVCLIKIPYMFLICVVRWNIWKIIWKRKKKYYEKRKRKHNENNIIGKR